METGIMSEQAKKLAQALRSLSTGVDAYRAVADAAAAAAAAAATAEEAARAYDDAARKKWGADAALNFPGPGEKSARRDR